MELVVESGGDIEEFLELYEQSLVEKHSIIYTLSDLELIGKTMQQLAKVK